MSRFRTIVWDWNGTVLDDVEICFRTINRLLTENGLAPLPDLEAYRRVFRFPVIEYYRAVGFDFSKTPFDALAERYMDLYHPAAVGCPLMPGAEEALRSLHLRGIRQVLLSASKQEHLEMQLARVPVRRWFDEVLGVADIYATSKADLAKRFVAGCGEAPETILFLGDTVHDHEVAAACGCPCVLFSGGHQAADLLRATGRPVIGSLNELVPLLGEKAAADAD